MLVMKRKPESISLTPSESNVLMTKTLVGMFERGLFTPYTIMVMSVPDRMASVV